jgi:hypothetical protein
MKIAPTIANETKKVATLAGTAGTSYKNFLLFYCNIGLPVIVPEANDPRYNSLPRTLWFNTIPGAASHAWTHGNAGPSGMRTNYLKQGEIHVCQR